MDDEVRLNKAQVLLLQKYTYWKKGIPTYMFKREEIRDIKDMVAIDNAISQNVKRKQQLNNLINQSRSMYG